MDRQGCNHNDQRSRQYEATSTCTMQAHAHTGAGSTSAGTWRHDGAKASDSRVPQYRQLGSGVCLSACAADTLQPLLPAADGAVAAVGSCC